MLCFYPDTYRERAKVKQKICKPKRKRAMVNISLSAKKISFMQKL